VNISGGAVTACFKKDSWPSPCLHTFPHTASRGKGSCTQESPTSSGELIAVHDRMWTIKPSGILLDADGTFYTKAKLTKMVGTLSSRPAQVVAQQLQILE